MEPDGDPLERQVVSLLFELGGHLRAHLARVAASLDLSPMQARALHHLGEPCPMGEVAARLDCDASNVTGIVDRLEERGLVERQADPADRRRKLLVTTPAGTTQRQVLHDRIRDGHPILKGLDPEQRAQLRDLLRTAIEAYVADLGTAESADGRTATR